MSEPKASKPNPPTTAGATAAEIGQMPPVVVKKYANRRLYNTESSSYITLENLAEMVHAGRDFVVYDAKSGDDITRGVLTQIIVEEESKGRALLPTNFLRQLIGFYGDSMQTLVPRFLEQAMNNFSHQQEQVRTAMQQTMGNLFPFGMEEVGRQNMAMMERAMSLFSPFYRGPGHLGGENPQQGMPAGPRPASTQPGGMPPGGLQPQPGGEPRAPAAPVEDELVRLRGELERLHAELAAIRKRGA